MKPEKSTKISLSKRLMSEMSDQLISFNELEIEKEIGKGTFGVVFKGILQILI